MPITTTILTFRFSGRALKLEAFDLLFSHAVELILDLKFRTQISMSNELKKEKLYFYSNKVEYLHLCALIAVSRLGSLGMVDLNLAKAILASETTCSSHVG